MCPFNIIIFFICVSAESRAYVSDYLHFYIDWKNRGKKIDFESRLAEGRVWAFHKWSDLSGKQILPRVLKVGTSHNECQLLWHDKSLQTWNFKQVCPYTHGFWDLKIWMGGCWGESAKGWRNAWCSELKPWHCLAPTSITTPCSPPVDTHLTALEGATLHFWAQVLNYQVCAPGVIIARSVLQVPQILLPSCWKYMHCA